METLFDKIENPVQIKTQRLLITEIKNADKERYATLYLDEELNKWWGYDYKEDLKGGQATADYFFTFQQSLKEKKEEFSFAVKKDGVMIGELVLHNFGKDLSVEMGFRFFKSEQGKGYALESALALKEYVFCTLGAKVLKSRCFKQNVASKKLIERLGLIKVSEDQTHYYFQASKL